MRPWRCRRPKETIQCSIGNATSTPRHLAPLALAAIVPRPRSSPRTINAFERPSRRHWPRRRISRRMLPGSDRTGARARQSRAGKTAGASCPAASASARSAATAPARIRSVSDVIKLNYEGRLTDGTVFDSSSRAASPEIFPLNQLIRGWQMAVPQMGVGDTAEIAIPAEFAYGPRGGPHSRRRDALFQDRIAGQSRPGLSAASQRVPNTFVGILSPAVRKWRYRIVLSMRDGGDPALMGTGNRGVTGVDRAKPGR